MFKYIEDMTLKIKKTQGITINMINQHLSQKHSVILSDRNNSMNNINNVNNILLDTFI